MPSIARSRFVPPLLPSSPPLLSSPLLLLILTLSLSLFLSLFLPQAKVAVLLKTWGLGERTKMGLLRAKVKGARR